MKVGDYVRTKRGLIAKIVNINDFREPNMKYGIEASYLDDIWFIGDDDIKLVKEKPIDLIEVGDYVNGCLIVEIEKDPFIKGQINLWTNMIKSFGEPFPNEYYKAKILENGIKSIVTKEQFEAIQYKVGE